MSDAMITRAFAADLAARAPAPADVGCPVCGRDACEDDHAPPPAASHRFLTAAQVLTLPRPEVIVAGLLWAGGITTLIGESASGKSFVALNLAAHLAAGLPWHGRRVLRGSVAYCSFEGDALRLRLGALREQGHVLEHLYVLRATELLSPTVDPRSRLELPSLGEAQLSADLAALSAELAAAGSPPIRLIALDTLRASLAGNEDSSENVAAYLRAVRRLLAAVPHAAALLPHHSGWQDGDTARKRERGSSALRGNVDATVYLEAADPAPDGTAAITLRTLKVRDGERPAPLHLVRRRVELPEYDDGEPVTSCVIETDRTTREDREAAAAARATTAARALDLDVLRLIAARPDLAARADAIAAALQRRRQDVTASLSRLLVDDCLHRRTARAPYVPTAAGRALLAGPLS